MFKYEAAMVRLENDDELYSDLYSMAKITVEEIASMYIKDDKPWIVGFSGGKDSTTLLQLVFHALNLIPLEKRKKIVHVVCSDTLVEQPYVKKYIDRVLKLIQLSANKLSLPIKVNKVVPDIEDTFFVNLIGKGYPAPNRWFRWCTERLKIKPTSQFIKNEIEQRGSVIILLGARKAESVSRAQVLANHAIKGNILRRHTSLKNAFVYTPISEWLNEDVWDFLRIFPSPWEGDNLELLKLYQDANGGECPLVIDTTTPSCGKSRFGCWVCTVVNTDKSMKGFIDSGLENLEPLLNFRNWLKEIRDDETKRDHIRRNLTKGLGPFTLDTRKEILRRLLEISKKTGWQLIKMEELNLIQSYWTQDGANQDEAVNIYNEVLERGGKMLLSEQNIKNKEKENELLSEICSKKNISPNDIHSLIELELQLIGKKKRRGLYSKIDEIIKRIVYKKESDESVT